MEDITVDEFPNVEYLAVQPESLEQIFYTDNSTVYMHEGQYFIATDSQMVLLDNETTNQELVIEDSTGMIQEENPFILSDDMHSEVSCEPHIDEVAIQQDAVYELNIVDPLQMDEDLTEINEEQEPEVNGDQNELADMVVGKNLVTGKTVTLHKYLEKVQHKEKKHTVKESAPLQLSTYSSGKLMHGRILDIRKPEEKELTEEYCERINKTLSGLMKMESIQKSFEGNPLIIKVNELEDSQQVFKGKAHGFMSKDEDDKWCFVQFNDKLMVDEANEAKLKHRYADHVCATITLSRFMGRLKTMKVYQSVERKQNVCIVCCKEFGSMKGLDQHYLSHMDTDPDLLQPSLIYPCEICNKVFNNSMSFKRHQAVHNYKMRDLECVVCEQRFTNSWLLKRHSLSHKGIKPHSCDLCNKSFALAGDLNTHRKIHFGSKVHLYECSVCGRTFSRQGNMLRHASIHNNGDHKCHLCGSSYQFASSLTRHIMQTHVSTNTS